MISINLLPRSRRRLLTVESYFGVVSWIAIVVIAGLAVVFGLSYLVRLDVTRETATLTSERDRASKTVVTFDTVAAQSQALATSAAEYNQLIVKQRAWATFFAYLENNIPPDVSLTTVSTANEQELFSVILSGTAANQTTVGLFREKILAYEAPGEAGRRRVTQALVDNVAANPAGGETFTLRLTIDLSAVKTTTDGA